ncbi:hypothetical protein scyTo_0025061, partial [Scyliorhinus torazame]|nr:hypothetical protein [Scyliorhinus torazame]
LHFSYVLIIVLLLTILSCGFLAGFLAFVRSDRHCRGSKEHAESQVRRGRHGNEERERRGGRECRGGWRGTK